MYINFRRYSLSCDLDKNRFSVWYDGMGEIVREMGIVELVSKREPQVTLADYAAPVAQVSRGDSSAELTVTWSGAAMNRQDVSLRFTLSKNGVTMFVGGEGTACVRFAGRVHWGDHDQKETMAVNLNGATRSLRSAHGPAASALAQTPRWALRQLRKAAMKSARRWPRPTWSSSPQARVAAPAPALLRLSLRSRARKSAR